MALLKRVVAGYASKLRALLRAALPRLNSTIMRIRFLFFAAASGCLLLIGAVEAGNLSAVPAAM
ncbi:MAG: hypothetical protein HIU89_02010 [Proteobacteria bacterium]|nr:hypothetical protein [Pseudomonadota bacterium]